MLKIRGGGNYDSKYDIYIYTHTHSLNASANRIKLDPEGQYNFVNSMGSHSVLTH